MKRYKITVDNDKCAGDCEDACPVEVYELRDGKAVPVDMEVEISAALESARAQDRERIEALEWLVEVQDFYMHRLRNPGGWAPVGCDRALMPKFWACRSNSNDELRDSYKAARAAAGV